MDVLGATRSSIQPDHALITPDTHVGCQLPGWTNASVVVHISPHLGARFTQYTAELEAGAVGKSPAAGIERFFFVQRGKVKLAVESSSPVSLAEGGYAFLPAGQAHEISADRQARLLVFEKRYQPLAGSALPQAVVGTEKDVPSRPFLGDEDAQLKTLLPDESSLDMAVNLFEYQPGATLPQVEIHVMEHGLMMLEGAGVYRLGDRWYPVTAGDVIWMKAYCPQWFVAMGKQPARYLYYKDINRDPSDDAP